MEHSWRQSEKGDVSQNVLVDFSDFYGFHIFF